MIFSFSFLRLLAYIPGWRHNEGDGIFARWRLRLLFAEVGGISTGGSGMHHCS